VREENILSTE